MTPGRAALVGLMHRYLGGLIDPFVTLLSTVHWVISTEQARTMDDVVERIYGWNDRKRHFTRRQIALAVDVLRSKGWIGLGTLIAD